MKANSGIATDSTPGNHLSSSQQSSFVPPSLRPTPSLTNLKFLHLILSWQRFLSWVLFVLDVCLIAFLTMHAYRDGTASCPFITWFGIGIHADLSTS